MTLRAYLDKSPSLGEGVYVDPTALVIGDVTLGDAVLGLADDGDPR